MDTITGNDGAGAQLSGKLGLVNSVRSVMGYYMRSKNDAQQRSICMRKNGDYIGNY